MLYNNTTKKWEIGNQNIIKGIVYIDSNYVEYGYFNKNYQCIPFYNENAKTFIINKESCKIKLFWCNKYGLYFDRNIPFDAKMISKHNWEYPIPPCYNFCKHNIEKNNLQNIKCEDEYNYIKDFTFGFEFETAAGNVPWIDLMENNLIPLYDGSITGHEYVTFPLYYNELPVIKQYLTLLEEYTYYDKNCSLHIHFGGFPVDQYKITQLCKSWYYFQKILQKYIPLYSYYVERYKSNGKPYNKPMPMINNFSHFYNKYTDNDFIDNTSLYLENQYDAAEERKWEVHGRYFNMNIMHLIAGKDHKTVEFRFLRPTTNYNEIKWYILILSAFLKYVMNNKNINYRYIDINLIINYTFPKEIADKLLKQAHTLYRLHKIQITNNDKAGLNDSLKYYYFDKNKFNVY